MTKKLNFDERWNLITRNLQEIIDSDKLKELVKSEKEISIYWGTMPTGSISIAYFFPLMKIADFLKAGIRVKILLADLHAALDGVPWEILEKRYEYYKGMITSILEIIGVDINNLEFCRGRDLQLNKDYFSDLLKLSTLTSLHDSTKAASEVVKTAVGENVKIAGMIYPLMQALDEEYLKVDAQFGGTDQRKIMVYAREYLPKIGYEPRIEIMNPMIRGLIGEKMSSSIEGTKIDTLESEESVKSKVNKAECVEGDPDNGIMALLKYVIFVLKEERNEKLLIERPEKYGGNKEYSSYDELEKDFVAKSLHPMDLKVALAKELNVLLKKLRDNKELVKLHSLAYE